MRYSALVAHAGSLLGLLTLVLVAARVGGRLAERMRQPAVLGELAAGISLGLLATAGVHGLDVLRTDETLHFVAEIGVMLLMFEVGLESHLGELRRVGARAAAVAVVGVVVPAALGALVAWRFDPSATVHSHLFVGATLSATSVGITARVLRDLGKSQSLEARIILAAAVLDDVLGLLLLATIAALVRAHGVHASVSVSSLVWIVAKAVGFLVIALAAGPAVARATFSAFGRLGGSGALIGAAAVLCFGWGYAADRLGLAPAIGAFVAGLAITPETYASLRASGEGTLEERLASLVVLFVPVFFVLAGVRVDLLELREPRVVGIATLLTLAAIVGKLVAGIPARGSGASAWAVGVGMIPRGEVGLIFASVGASLTLRGHPVISRSMFTAVVIMVAVTSLVPPPLLSRALRTDAAAKRSFLRRRPTPNPEATP